MNAVAVSYPFPSVFSSYPSRSFVISCHLFHFGSFRTTWVPHSSVDCARRTASGAREALSTVGVTGEAKQQPASVGRARRRPPGVMVPVPESMKGPSGVQARLPRGCVRLPRSLPLRVSLIPGRNFTSGQHNGEATLWHYFAALRAESSA